MFHDSGENGVGDGGYYEANPPDSPFPFGWPDPGDAESHSKVLQYIDAILAQAVRDHATEIRFEPVAGGLTVWYLFEGKLYEFIPPPDHLAHEVVDRVKTLARLELGEACHSQAGALYIRVRGKAYRTRVVTSLTTLGERVVVEIAEAGGNTAAPPHARPGV